jgi:hypothetical protein
VNAVVDALQSFMSGTSTCRSARARGTRCTTPGLNQAFAQFESVFG